MRVSSVVVLAVTPCLGCFSTWDLAPKDLHTLSSFEAHRSAIDMRDHDGKRFTFDQDTKLTFDHDRPGDAPSHDAHRFSSIYLVDSYTLAGFDEGRDHVTVDLTDVQHVKAKNFSAGKTVALSVGATFGVAAVAGLVFVIVNPALGPSWGGGGGFSIGYAGAVPFDVKEPRRAGIGTVPGAGATWSRSR